MHFTWEITLGQVVISVPIFWLLVMIARIYGMMLNFRMEHEVLMIEWAERNDKKLHDLPTRMKKWW